MGKNKAFTLVELMIVVAVIGLLAMVSSATYLQYRKDSRFSLCRSNLKLCRNAMKSYFTKNDAYPLDQNHLVGYLENIPTCTAGGAYTWELDANSFHVFCETEHSPTVNYVYITELEGLTASFR